MLEADRVAVPRHFDIEVYVGVRRFVRRGLLPPVALDRLVTALIRFAVTRVEPVQLLSAMHALGDRFSPYDAAYVALARGLDAELVTADARLARATEGLARVRLIGPPAPSRH